MAKHGDEYEYGKKIQNREMKILKYDSLVSQTAKKKLSQSGICNYVNYFLWYVINHRALNSVAA